MASGKFEGLSSHVGETARVYMEPSHGLTYLGVLGSIDIQNGFIQLEGQEATWINLRYVRTIKFKEVQVGEFLTGGVK